MAMPICTVRVRGWMHKGLLPVLGAPLLVSGLLYVFQPYVGSKNSDSEFGYYGQYNRVKHVLESMPNVRIVAHWRHHDLTSKPIDSRQPMLAKRKLRLGESSPTPIDAKQPTPGDPLTTAQPK